MDQRPIPLSAELALGERITLSETRVIDDWVIWLEQRPYEDGRTTVLIRPWGSSQCFGQELTPSPINVRSRVHGYGGGSVSIESQGQDIYLSWIDDCDGCIWIQQWQCLSDATCKNQNWFKPLKPSVCLSLKGSDSFTHGFIDLLRNLWIGVMESKGKDYLVSLSLDREHQIPTIIYRPKDFIGYVVLSPDRYQLAWVEWQHPNMPWDASDLWWSRLNELGEITEIAKLFGSDDSMKRTTSVFQPIWLPSGQLMFAEDSSGWWNLIVSGSEVQLDKQTIWKRLWPLKAEAGMPQWVSGMSTTSASSKNILSANCEEGSWRLISLTLDGIQKTLEQPFDDLSGLSVDGNKAVAIASNSLTESGLLEIDISTGSWHHTPVRPAVLEPSEISRPQPFWFKGFNDQLTHSWYYPPTKSLGKASPLLVTSHSGPTGMARRGLDLGIQFWTSRGWGVVDVNYGGSTGFGREYRDRLKGGWGEVDVFDCAAVAKALIAAGKADEKYIAIEGSSASGFTTLACLCFTNIFRIGACRYGISDLISMAEKTHRFEAGYLDYLLGPFKQNKQIYNDRSPLNHASKIDCPVIFFQGLKDKVVLPEQTEKMVAQIRKNKIPVEVYKFPEEGHGFRNRASKIKVLKYTEKFFTKYLGL